MDWTGTIAVVLIFSLPAVIMALIYRHKRRRMEHEHRMAELEVQNNTSLPDATLKRAMHDLLGVQKNLSEEVQQLQVRVAELEKQVARTPEKTRARRLAEEPTLLDAPVLDNSAQETA